MGWSSQNGWQGDAAGGWSLPFAPAVPLWTPDLIGTALVHWWDANAGITLASGKVSTWTDRIGGLAPTQATTASQPTPATRNGKASVHFASSAWLATSSVGSLPVGSAASTIVVAGYQSSSGGPQAAFAWGNSTYQQLRCIQKTSGNLVGFSAYYADQNATESWANVDRLVISQIAAGANPTGTLNVDGNTTETINPLYSGSLATASGPTIIGQSVNANTAGYLVGDIQQILVFNRVLTTSERQKIEGWESWVDGKAGTNLPSGHPYKSRAPITTDP